jgi:molybdate transport system substrate-binding protein
MFAANYKSWEEIMKCSIATALLGLALIAAPLAHAAELKVIAGGAMTGSLKELAPKFEAASGHKLSIRFAATPQLIKMATSGQPFDVAVVPVDVYKNAEAKAKFADGPTVDIARVGFGVAIKAGAPKPDVSTAAALKDTLIRAKSIALLPESAAGAYVAKVVERLGVTEAVNAKAVKQTAPAGIPQAVANGDAELGLFLTNVLIAPGVELAGPFPGELQQELVFAAAVAADSKEAAAKAFIDYLRTPEAKAIFKAKGVTPG